MPLMKKLSTETLSAIFSPEYKLFNVKMSITKVFYAVSKDLKEDEATFTLNTIGNTVPDISQAALLFSFAINI